MRNAFKSGSADADAPEVQPFEVPDDALVGVLEARSASVREDEDALLERAFREAVEAPPLRELAADARRVVILVDDATRSTRAEPVLRIVARELAAAGVADDAVTLLMARGTHRRMIRDELVRKVGSHFLERFRIEQHEYRNRERLVEKGVTRGRMPVVVNALVDEADVVLGIGQVGVHGILGYSGGAKIMIPGVAGEASEAFTHWRASASRIETIMGVPDTPIRLEVEEGARLAGLDAVLNVTMDREGRIAQAAYGDFVAAQRRCARAAYELGAAPLSEVVDVVVTDSHPADLEFWQAIKGLYAASLCVRDGGVIVLATPCPEGVASTHPHLLDMARLSVDDLEAAVEKGAITDLIAAGVARFLASIRGRSDILLVSSGITGVEARALGFEPFARLQDAVDESMRRVGANPRIAVLQGAGRLLPVVEGRNRRIVEDAWGGAAHEDISSSESSSTRSNGATEQRR